MPHHILTEWSIWNSYGLFSQFWLQNKDAKIDNGYVGSELFRRVGESIGIFSHEIPKFPAELLSSGFVPETKSLPCLFWVSGEEIQSQD